MFDDGADQPVVSATAHKMLIGDRTFQKTQALLDLYIISFDVPESRSVLGMLQLVAGDHQFAHNRRTGARAANNASALICVVNSFLNFSSQHNIHKTVLVAAGNIDELCV